MTEPIILQRKWTERAMCVVGLCVGLSFIPEIVFMGKRTLLEVILLIIGMLLWIWFTWRSFTTPEAVLSEGQIQLHKLVSPKPLVLALEDIRSIHRNASARPIWRVPPLEFSLSTGDKIGFSTGGDERKMKRIIAFIEDHAGFKVEINS